MLAKKKAATWINLTTTTGADKLSRLKWVTKNRKDISLVTEESTVKVVLF